MGQSLINLQNSSFNLRQVYVNGTCGLKMVGNPRLAASLTVDDTP